MSDVHLSICRVDPSSVDFSFRVNGEYAGQIDLEWDGDDFRQVCQRAIVMTRALLGDDGRFTTDLLAKHWNHDDVDRWALYETVRDLDTDLASTH